MRDVRELLASDPSRFVPTTPLLSRRSASARERSGEDTVTTIDEMPPTLSVVRAGEFLGMSRTAAYRAVERGELPTIRLAGRLRVPTAKLLRLIGVEEPAVRVTSSGDQGSPPLSLSI
jgi:hypothetical protein